MHARDGGTCSPRHREEPRAAWHLGFGWNRLSVGRSRSRPAYRVTASSRCREGRRVAEFSKRANRAVHAELRKEKYDTPATA